MVQRLLLTMIFLGTLGTACRHATIEGTQVQDTTDNRAIFDVIVTVRKALVNRDRNLLLSVVSPQYFEDCGTPDPTDDYGYTELKEKIMSDALEQVKEVFIAFQVFDIQVNGNLARADLRYNSRTRLDLPAGSLWDTHRDFDRLELVKEDGKWRITSGL